MKIAESTNSTSMECALEIEKEKRKIQSRSSNVRWKNKSKALLNDNIISRNE